MGGKRREDITVEPIELLPKEGEVIAGVRLHAAFFQCSRCGAIKPGVDVGLRRNTKDGIVRNQAQCNSCRSLGKRKREGNHESDNQLDFDDILR